MFIDLKKLNEQLNKNYESLEKAEHARDTLCHMIVHDLKNSLSIIKGYSEIIEFSEDKELAIKSIPKIINATDKMEVLIKSILDLSKLESEEMPVTFECFNLIPFMSDIYEQFMPQAKSIGVGMTLEYGDDEIITEADKDLMSRIVHNLINNALKHTKSHISIFKEQQENQPLLCIADDGPGIPEKYKKKIFDKYFQIEESNEHEKYGVGLGLAFCNLAVKAQKGEIWVESTDENKTCFKVRLKSPTS